MSTIEAIYYCCVEYFRATHNPVHTPYDGRYDNLLFYISFFHQQMRDLITTQGKSFQAFLARESTHCEPSL
ncbi:unnamed protein product [Echinostoma caproni]|uniref:Uncharacterized protein n=1 Tax=Echinostoma caproni TaxID=27848 RepID=A0A3P8KXZ0_9TREM|nr:unnamed protein product [Echinostoma caproni]